jgi:hypothetical protein
MRMDLHDGVRSFATLNTAHESHTHHRFPQPIPSGVDVPPAFAEIVATDGLNATAAKHGSEY